MELTTYEASQKYGLSQGYLRLLLGKRILKARRIQITKRIAIWLIDQRSLKSFLKRPRRKPGPKKQ
jgi:hypothetical protein